MFNGRGYDSCWKNGTRRGWCLREVETASDASLPLHFLEEHHLLNTYQCGLHSQPSTQDNLVHLETTVREAFVNRQFYLAVFFDLEKAYDTTWRFGILSDLSGLGVRGRMLGFIQSYIVERIFRVRLGNTLSKPYMQENGVPQGVLTPEFINAPFLTTAPYPIKGKACLFYKPTLSLRTPFCRLI